MDKPSSKDINTTDIATYSLFSTQEIKQQWACMEEHEYKIYGNLLPIIG